MSKLYEIPVVAAAAAPPGEPDGPAVLALLSEIEAKLGALRGAGEPASIDLRWLMASRQTLECLDAALGEGEVEAKIAGAGVCRVLETAVPCVWRVSHRAADGRPLGEFVEITEIPELLRADRLAIPRAQAALRNLCGRPGSLP